MHNLLETKIKINNIKNITLFIILNIINILLYKEKYDFSITLINFLSFVFVYKFWFDISIVKSVINTFFMMAIIFVSEIITSIIIVIFLRFDIETVRKMDYLSLVLNSMVGIIGIYLFNIKPIRNKLREIIYWINERQKIAIVSFFIAQIIAIGMLFSKLETMYNLNSMFFINLAIIILFLVIFLIFVFEKANHNKLIFEYDSLFKYSKDIEKMMEVQRINNHENKNQLITIKSMVSKNNKKLLEYINSIISDIYIEENEWMSKLKNLPKGGLKGLIYYKISQMKNENIKIILDIDKNINKGNFSNFSIDDYKQLCRILGVYLDNAIEATKKCNKKEISIEIFKNKNNIEIVICNSYKESVNLDLLGKTKYTNKGIGRGYGLLLVENIINKCNIFSQYREIINDYFVQHIIINNKTTQN
jgi:two-component system, LytTR family, sensor histidine kinase AgrC